MCGAAGAALGSLGLRSSCAQSGVAQLSASLSFEPALVEMVDQTPVYHWLYKLQGSVLPSFPGPIFFVSEGDQITLALTNNLDEPHAFEVFRVPGAASGPIAPRGRRIVAFTAPAAGTYLYHDPLNAPVNRVMGLHGALVVLPRGVRENTAVNTPYSRPTANVQRLFNDLGATLPFPENPFPGDPWIPVRPATVPPIATLPPGIEPFLFRTRVWLFTQVDPRLNARVQALRPGAVFDAGRFQREFLPRYFLINGRSGVFAAHDHATHLEGFIGESIVVRALNAGLATVSLHHHANHFYILAVNNVVAENVIQVDTMTIGSLRTGGNRLFFNGGSTVDWLFPMIRPRDIPGNRRVPLRDLIPEELSLVLGDVAQSPLKYPAHNHIEPSQTAAGGNYPQGDVSDAIFFGDVDKTRFPESFVRAVGSGGSGPRSGRANSHAG